MIVAVPWATATILPFWILAIPVFEEVYVSETKLFDFFERRILAKDSNKQCEELAQTGGVSMVDSFFVEKVPEKLSEKYKKIVLEAYELQKKKESLNKVEKQKKSEEIGDI